MIELYREEILSKYVDHYNLTLEMREDSDKIYENIIDFEYKDDYKWWKKIIFPLNTIEDLEFWQYCNIFGKPTQNRLTYHPQMFKINFIPKYEYFNIIPKVRFYTWPTSDTPHDCMPLYEKIRLESLTAIFRETNNITFMKIQPKTIIKKIGNVSIKRTEHEHVIDCNKLFEIMNYEFRFFKFELTVDGFEKLYSDKRIDLSNKDYINRRK